MPLSIRELIASVVLGSHPSIMRRSQRSNPPRTAAACLTDLPTLQTDVPHIVDPGMDTMIADGSISMRPGASSAVRKASGDDGSWQEF